MEQLQEKKPFVTPSHLNWDGLVATIADTFRPKDLISHAYLKEKFNIVTPSPDNKTVEQLLEIIEDQEGVYRANCSALREDLLEKHQVYIRSSHGDGYYIMPAGEQTQYAEQKGFEGAKRNLDMAEKIMKNVRTGPGGLNAHELQENRRAIMRINALQDALEKEKVKQDRELEAEQVQLEYNRIHGH